MTMHAQQRVFTLMEWNCENLFDCRHDSLKNDYEWLPESERQWSYWRYWHKLNNIGQTIIACGERYDVSETDTISSWQLPDIVILTEVENDSVLFDLTKRSLLRKARYEFVVTDSPDERGIDVAVLYSPFSFSLHKVHSLRVTPVKNMRPTRDILYLKGMISKIDTLHVFAVHAPSRSGGERHSRPFRMAVTERLLSAVDSIRMISPDAKIIVAGDFNDYSKSPSLKLLRDSGLIDISEHATGENGALATYRYRGEWDSLDHIFSSETLSRNVSACDIFDSPFLLEPDNTYGGVKPKRTYLGPFYRGGISDHLPLVARFRF